MFECILNHRSPAKCKWSSYDTKGKNICNTFEYHYDCPYRKEYNIIDDLKKELSMVKKDCRLLCSFNKSYNCEEINKLTHRIRNLHLRINQENMKLFAPDHRRKNK